jgi:hypothetical protein
LRKKKKKEEVEEEETNINNRWRNMSGRGKSRWRWGKNYCDDEIKDESRRVLADRRENMKAPFAFPRQDADRPNSTRARV